MMEREKLIEAVRLCAYLKGCGDCAYIEEKECRLKMLRDVYAVLTEKEAEG